MDISIGWLLLVLSYSTACASVIQKESIDKLYIFKNVGHTPEDGLMWEHFNEISTGGRLYANFSDYVDRTCILIRNNKKLDSVEIPDRTTHSLLVSAMSIFGKYYTNGQLEGLRTISRKGNCFVNYEVKLLLMVTKFHFQEFKVTYDLMVKFIFFNMNFKFSLVLDDVDIETGVLVDANRFQFTMDRLVIPHARTLRIKISGKGVLGWIIDKFMALTTFVFKTPIIHHIEKDMVDTIQSIFDHLPFYNKTSPIHVSPFCEGPPI